MKTITLTELERDTRACLRRVAEGEPVLIVDDEQAVAELRPVGRPSADDRALRPIGLYSGQFTVPDDFDDPLPEDILKRFEAGE